MDGYELELEEHWFHWPQVKKFSQLTHQKEEWDGKGWQLFGSTPSN